MSRVFREARHEIEQGVHTLACSVGHATELVAKYRSIFTEGDIEALEMAALELSVLIELSKRQEAAE